MPWSPAERVNLVRGGRRYARTRVEPRRRPRKVDNLAVRVLVNQDGEELGARAAVADDTDRLAVEVDLVVPARRVEPLALEVGQARQRRRRVERRREAANTRDQDLGLDNPSVLRLGSAF